MRGERREDLSAQRPEPPRRAERGERAEGPERDATPVQADATAAPKDPALDPALRSPVGPQGGDARTPVAQPTPFSDAVADAAATIAQAATATTAAPAEPALTPTPTPALPTAAAHAVAADVPAAPAAQVVAGAVPQTTSADASSDVVKPAGTAVPAAEGEATAVVAPTTAPATDAAEPADAEAGDAGLPEHAGAQAQTGKGDRHAGGEARGERPADASRVPQAPGPSVVEAPVTAAAQAVTTAAAPSADATAGAAVKAADGPLAAPAGTSVAAPLAETPATAPTAGPRGSVGLEQLARTAEAAMQMAAGRGITRARLHLNPAELGAIEIHLRHSAAGLTARLVADSPEAVAMLQQASNDLRRQLEQAGISIIGLDIGARADDGAEQRSLAGAFAGRPEDGRPRGGGRHAPNRGRDALDDAPVQQIRSRVPLPGGALVDVLA
jgi:flagellar hook-length control protein FliK